MQALCEERQRDLHIHSTLGELDAYHRGTLPPEDRETVAEHLSVCEDCAILLLYGIIDANGDGHQASDGNGHRESKEIESAWAELQPHLEGSSPAGTTLSSLLEDGPLGVDEALPIAIGISRAMAKIHAKGRWLSNLRAEDVVLDPSGQIRLPDLGIHPSPKSFEVGYGRPAADVVVNLYCSMSPEQVAGERLDCRSNLFSLGVLLYEMLTGESPFKASTPLQTASRIFSLKPASVSELNPDLPPRLSAVIDRLLAKEPEDRPPSAESVAVELEAMAGSAGRHATESRSVEAVTIEEEIERLYDKIIALSSHEGESAACNEEIESAYARLLELQTAEAELFREWFESSLAMPIDAGKQILARASALREKLEDLASSDPAASDTDDP